MKGISILMGALFALGLGVAPAAFADDLDGVTVQVFDHVDEIGDAHLIEDEDVARADGDDHWSDGEDEGSDEGNGAALFDEEAHVVGLTEGGLDVGDHDEHNEGFVEDVVEPELHDGEHSEDGLEEGMGEDEVASESDVDIPEDGGDLV